MIALKTTILHGLLICMPFSIFVGISFMGNPRLWLHSLPLDIQKAALHKTLHEQRLTRFVLLPIFLFILPGLSIISTIYAANSTIPPPGFYGVLLHLYLLWIIVHLWDLIIIDGVAILIINPAHPPIAGTANAAGWKDYNFHLRSFVQAVVKSAIFVLPTSAIIHYFFQHLPT